MKLSTEHPRPHYHVLPWLWPVRSIAQDLPAFRAFLSWHPRHLLLICGRGWRFISQFRDQPCCRMSWAQKFLNHRNTPMTSSCKHLEMNTTALGAFAATSRLCGKQKACWQSFRNRRGSSSIVMTFKSLRRHNTSLLQVLLAVYLYQSSSRALRNKLLCKREVPHAWQLVGPKAGSWLARHSVASALLRGVRAGMIRHDQAWSRVLFVVVSWLWAIGFRHSVCVTYQA